MKSVVSNNLHRRTAFFLHFSQFTRVAHGNGGALKAQVQSKFHSKNKKSSKFRDKKQYFSR